MMMMWKQHLLRLVTENSGPLQALEISVGGRTIIYMLYLSLEKQTNIRFLTLSNLRCASGFISVPYLRA